MFEQELQMEKRASSIIPLLLLVILIVGIVGVTFYFVAENRKVLSSAEVTPLIQQSIERQAPASVRFQIGTITAESSQDVRNPQYLLLAKAGYVQVGKTVKGNTPVSLTAEGQAFLDSIAGVKKVKKDDNDEYTVPLAHRKLLEIGKITMQPPGKAVVEYTWQWETNKGGDLFDAAGPMAQSLGTYQRSALIEKYGGNFYHQGPSKVSVLLVKEDNGWQVSSRGY